MNNEEIQTKLQQDHERRLAEREAMKKARSERGNNEKDVPMYVASQYTLAGLRASNAIEQERIRASQEARREAARIQRAEERQRTFELRKQQEEKIRKIEEERAAQSSMQEQQMEETLEENEEDTQNAEEAEEDAVLEEVVLEQESKTPEHSPDDLAQMQSVRDMFTSMGVNLEEGPVAPDATFPLPDQIFIGETIVVCTFYAEGTTIHQDIDEARVAYYKKKFNQQPIVFVFCMLKFTKANRLYKVIETRLRKDLAKIFADFEKTKLYERYATRLLI